MIETGAPLLSGAAVLQRFEDPNARMSVAWRHLIVQEQVGLSQILQLQKFFLQVQRSCYLGLAQGECLDLGEHDDRRTAHARNATRLS